MEIAPPSGVEPGLACPVGTCKEGRIPLIPLPAKFDAVAPEKVLRTFYGTPGDPLSRRGRSCRMRPSMPLELERQSGHNWARSLVLISLIGQIAGPGCAKVGDPLPPLSQPSPTIRNLKLVQVDDRIQLHFPLASRDVVQVQIYRQCPGGEGPQEPVMLLDRGQLRGRNDGAEFLVERKLPDDEDPHAATTYDSWTRTTAFLRLPTWSGRPPSKRRQRPGICAVKSTRTTCGWSGTAPSRTSTGAVRPTSPDTWSIPGIVLPPKCFGTRSSASVTPSGTAFRPSAALPIL